MRRYSRALLLMLAAACGTDERLATTEDAITAIPARIQAEDFDPGGYFDTTSSNLGGAYRPLEGVDIASFFPDVDGAYEVGWIIAGEWLEYTIDVPSSGWYFLRLRLAQYGSGGRFGVTVDGSTALSSIEVPDTAGYANWITLPAARIWLSAGQRRLRLVFTQNGTNGGVMNLNWLELSRVSNLVPGRIQAEDFDPVQNFGYFDNTVANQGTMYRPNERVDIGDDFPDDDASFEVGWITGGEWLRYTVNVTAPGEYSLRMRVAQVSPGATFRVRVDNVIVTPVLSVPTTGAYARWVTIPVAIVSLTAGIHRVRVDFLNNGTNGGVMNFNWFELVPRPNRVPGRIQAEDYSSFFDDSPGNIGGAYRNDDVDIYWDFARDEDMTAGVGWIHAGERLGYTIDVAETAEYALRFRLAQNAWGARFHVELDGADVTGPIDVPHTTDIAHYVTLSAGSFDLTAGRHLLRLVFDAGATHGYVMNLNWLELTRVSANELESRNSGSPDLLFATPTNAIKGFGSSASVNLGEQIVFFVDSVQPYEVQIIRLGGYGGTFARAMTSPVLLPAQPQPACGGDPVECPWAPAYALTIPNDWVSGVYLARLVSDQGSNFVPFVVRDDARIADFLYVHPSTTYQAYNNYPTEECGGQGSGRSTYGFNSMDGIPAARVSFLRPFCGTGSGTASGFDGDLFLHELPMIAWLEDQGYDVAYTESIALHRMAPPFLERYRAIVSVGHDEYWSMEMRNKIERARDRGPSLAFVGSNDAYWHIRFEFGDYTMVAYKDAALDPHPDPAMKTTLFRNLGRDEHALMGVHYPEEPGHCCVFAPSYQPLTAIGTGGWVWAASGVGEGAQVPGLLGHEVDRIDPPAPSPQSIAGSFLALADSTFSPGGGPDGRQSSVVFQAYSGAWIFSAGTLGWPLGLHLAPNVDDRRHAGLQQATRNIFDRMLARE